MTIASLPIRRAIVSLFVAAYSILFTGCSSDGPEVVPVSGRITKGGKPVSNVVVQFYPTQGRPSACRTDENGQYKPEFSPDIPHGVMPGKNKVSIQVVQQSIDKPVNLKDGSYHPDMPEILEHFGNWKTTELEVEVRFDQPEINIELDDYL